MENIFTEERDKVFIVTIDRPERKNAIDKQTADELYQAFEFFDRNDSLYVAILTGSDNVFCSGADLKSIAEETGAPELNKDGRAPLGVSRMQLSKPVLSAVEGFAVAGGLELALWCDLRVAATDAVFGVFCRRFGVPLVDGGTIRLPRLIGQSHAMDMILTGRGVSGNEALSMGLINRLTATGKSLETALELANDLCRFPQTCMRSDRLSALEQWAISEKEALINESNRGLQVLQSGETVSGAKKFIEKNF